MISSIVSGRARLCDEMLEAYILQRRDVAIMTLQLNIYSAAMIYRYA